jgi:hypothetical protein
MRGWARPPIRPLQEIRTHLDVRLQGNAENLARLARDWFYAARGGPCPLSGTWRNQTRSQRLVPLSVSTTVLNRFRPGRDRHPLVRHHDRLVQRPLCRSSPFLCQMPISWYEDFPRLPGRAGHAQSAHLRGAQHIVTAPQYPGTSAAVKSPVFGVVDGSLDGFCGGGPGVRLDLYRGMLAPPVVSRGWWERPIRARASPDAEQERSDRGEDGRGAAGPVGEGEGGEVMKAAGG